MDVVNVITLKDEISKIRPIHPLLSGRNVQRGYLGTRLQTAMRNLLKYGVTTQDLDNEDEKEEGWCWCWVS